MGISAGAGFEPHARQVTRRKTLTRFVDLVDQHALVVALEALGCKTQALRIGLAKRLQTGQGGPCC